MIRLILTGGQTGVDQAALAAAKAIGIPCGGWCPPGRICETGRIPDTYPLRETPTECSPSAPAIPRSLRTEWNVRDADAVLILIPANLHDAGTEWSLTCAQRYGKEIFIVDPFSPDAAEQIRFHLDHTPAEVLNISGPAESSYPGIYRRVWQILTKALSVSVKDSIS